MGIVYLASRRSDTVALKVIRDSLIDDELEATRFSREVSTLERISSPNVAQIVDAGVENGRPWFAAEFVNGPNLSDLVADKGPLGEEQWWNLARGLLGGLADVHKTGTIHRDIKPGNLIMSGSGPKLIDFGIAHVSDATSVTATGLVAGSPAWFSPEQIEGQELTSATDIFSAGSLLTFAGTGLSPWGGETTMTKASVFSILTSDPDLNGLSRAQSLLVEAMLCKDPSTRMSAEALRREIENLSTAPMAVRPEDDSDSAKTSAASPKSVAPLVSRSEQRERVAHGMQREENLGQTDPTPRSKSRGSYWLLAVAAVAIGATTAWVAVSAPPDSSVGTGEVVSPPPDSSVATGGVPEIVLQLEPTWVYSDDWSSREIDGTQFVVKVERVANDSPPTVVTLAVLGQDGATIRFAETKFSLITPGSCGEQIDLDSTGPARGNFWTFVAECGLPAVSEVQAMVDVQTASGSTLSYLCEAGGACNPLRTRE